MIIRSTIAPIKKAVAVLGDRETKRFGNSDTRRQLEKAGCFLLYLFTAVAAYPNYSINCWTPNKLAKLKLIDIETPVGSVRKKMGL